MKKSPQMKKLEETLRESKLSLAGFLGNDARDLTEILDADAREVASLGLTMEEIAERMHELTELAKAELGASCSVSGNIEVCADDNRGLIPCPWPHGALCQKTVTTATRVDLGKKIQWSDLSIHLIMEHGFFQGKGSPFRLEPRELVEIIFG
ncbi:hypothetical protein GX441_04750 [bacterium]|nr:hypothetical protein [bacterium]